MGESLQVSDANYPDSLSLTMTLTTIPTLTMTPTLFLTLTLQVTLTLTLQVTVAPTLTPRLALGDLESLRVKDAEVQAKRRELEEQYARCLGLALESGLGLRLGLGSAGGVACAVLIKSPAFALA